MVIVRDATRKDLPAILALYRETPELHRNTPVDLLDEDQRNYHLSRKNKILLVAVDKEESLKGFIYVGLKHRTIKEEKARLLHLAVAADSRQAGVATKLLKECEHRLKAMKIDHFYSCSNVTNKVMTKFLLKHGFAVQEVYFRFEKSLVSHPAWSRDPIEGWDDQSYDD